MEKRFEKMVRDFRRELIDDYSEGKITEEKYDELNFTIDDIIILYSKRVDISEMIRMLEVFKAVYTTMR